MLARAGLAVVTLAAIACGVRQAAPSSSSYIAPAGRETLITEEEITRMSVRTAWDVVRMRAPRLTSGLDANGKPARVRIQETRSELGDETPLLVVDKVQLADIDYLEQISASEVHAIHILDAEAAEPLFGFIAAGGAIVVETKHGR
ncbi:MAG TPA: hypothetical protein VMF70_16085 [Gemmatimonadales bacterium]|nr:hypothetical protein [Gemmatimonadales bacterium]